MAELSGKGNIATILAAVYGALEEEGIPREQVRSPWYFPTIGEYASMLERTGFDVAFMHLFDRPTPLEDCPNGVADWLRMFGGDLLARVPPERQGAVMNRANELSRAALYRDGRWLADYRRLRFVALRD